MAYSKAVIAIPNVTGNIAITVTTATSVQNLFDSATSSYNSRLGSSGGIESLDGGLVTNLIQLSSSMDKLHISGVTEVKNTTYDYFLRVVAYQSDGTTRESHVNYSSSATYEYDVAGLLSTHPNAAYLRFGIILQNGTAISQADTANLLIYAT